jgi:hypothetical protein
MDKIMTVYISLLFICLFDLYVSGVMKPRSSFNNVPALPSGGICLIKRAGESVFPLKADLWLSGRTVIVIPYCVQLSV